MSAVPRAAGDSAAERHALRFVLLIGVSRLFADFAREGARHAAAASRRLLASRHSLTCRSIAGGNCRLAAHRL
jgi:hypothetical protein